MNREIKFRGWNRETKKMVYNFVYFEHIMPEGKQEFMMPKMTVDFCMDIMQFTGLKDKNDKEIYEGDIVKYKFLSGFDCEDKYGLYKDGGKPYEVEKPKVIEFKDGAFTREYYHKCEDGFYSWREFDFEVIGNIYENPELLK